MGRKQQTARPTRSKERTKAEQRFAPPPPPEAFANASKASRRDDEVSANRASLHELFAQQTKAMLDRTDLDEEQKQSILVAMSCPCCGAGGLSFTAKIRRKAV